MEAIFKYELEAISQMTSLVYMVELIPYTTQFVDHHAQVIEIFNLVFNLAFNLAFNGKVFNLVCSLCRRVVIN